MLGPLILRSPRRSGRVSDLQLGYRALSSAFSILVFKKPATDRGLE